MDATISSAIIPSANHASWRSATPPPARPMCRLARVVALRMTRPPMAPSSGQSTFWSSRRSMPPRTLMGDSPLELDGGDFLQEDRVVDPPCDGRGDLTALAAALDEHDDHHFRVLHGREGGEPRVVLPPVRLRVRDHLGGPGLAGDLETRDARAGAGAVVVHHGPEALPQERPHCGIELHVSGNGPGVGP